MREQGICCISQQTYINKLVSTFLSDHDSTSVFFPPTPMETRVYNKRVLAQQEPDFLDPYRSIVGGLLFLFVCTRVDIGFAVSVLTQHLACPKPTHFLLAKRVLHYLQGTRTHGLLLGGEIIQSLEVFSDASFADDPFDRRSMGGYIIFWGTARYHGQPRNTGGCKRCRSLSRKSYKSPRLVKSCCGCSHCLLTSF